MPTYIGMQAAGESAVVHASYTVTVGIRDVAARLSLDARTYAPELELHEA